MNPSTRVWAVPGIVLSVCLAAACEHGAADDTPRGVQRANLVASSALPSSSALAQLDFRARRYRAGCSPWRDLSGAWLSRGYGLALRATQHELAIYDVSEHSCFPQLTSAREGGCERSLTLDLGSFEEPYPVVVTPEVFGPFMVLRDSGTTRYPFVRVPALPATCAHGGTPPSDDPVQNFELFWEHMNEHYAFFALHGVDWRESYTQHRPMVSAATTPDELFDLLTSMLAQVPDYHLMLASESRSYARPPPAAILANVAGINQYLIEHHLAAPNATVVGNGALAYQQLEDGVGYLLILRMAEFAERRVLGESEDAIRAEVEAAAEAIDEALRALSDSRALIVDVRFNGGGMDPVSLALAARFADRKRLAWWRVARDGDGYTWPELFHVEPAGVTASQLPTVVLTSPATLSAAETFVMAMRVLPQVVVMGESTAGSHSDVMTRQLANGCELGLSNQIYTAADGNVYERVGIPPDVAVELHPEAFARGEDVMAQAAVAYVDAP